MYSKVMGRLPLIQSSFIRLARFAAKKPLDEQVNILGECYGRDDFTNVTEKVISEIGRNLHHQPNHPLNHVRQKIENYFYKTFVNRRGNAIFSMHNNIAPVVNVNQNFDSLLIPSNHPSRLKSDCYYVNKNLLLRAHMTAHQADLLRSGLTNFLMTGDVYRRDEIDKTHYPIFHQTDAVRLKTKDDLFPSESELEIFEKVKNCYNVGNQAIQPCHSLEAVKLMEHELKSTLGGLAKELFGEKVEFRWVDAYFPFTQPSWEMEIYFNNNWLELLGCGIMRQTILENAGITDKIGWAFGLGLERIAMCIYEIPDIRLFWSKDSGFLNQFIGDYNTKLKYKPISQYPQCTNDISFWLPSGESFSSNDFYDLVRSIGGDIVEQVVLVDEFTHPKTKKNSHCYRIVYRHMERTLSQVEVNGIHKNIGTSASQLLGVTIR